jgi:hypothetical protein
MFLTVDDEGKFMGLIHPDTGDHYWYTRFPMGSSNSPAISGRFGAAFIRLICQEVEDIQGEVLITDWKLALKGNGFYPKRGIGRFLIGSDGLQVCLIWIHVDGIFLHGPTRGKFTSDLIKILDLTVLWALSVTRLNSSHPLRYINFVGFCTTPWELLS